MEITKRPYGRRLVEWAKDKPNVVVLSADLTGSCEADDFRNAYPERFFSMGIAEQNMLSWAAGMAREGFEPYVHTFAVFIYRQSFHQLAVSVAYSNLSVKFMGFLPGILTPGGMTHQATDDIALLRAVPNMTLLECGDATDVESVLDVVHSIDGPVYARMLRGEVPRLFPAEEPMRLGKARVLSMGDDVTVLTSGICTEEAMRVTAVLAGQGLHIQHLHISTLKPWDDPIVLQAVAQSRNGVITMENHTVVGGLGSATAEMIAEHGLGKKLVRMGLRDVYAHGASRSYLAREYGLDAISLVKQIECLVGAKFDVREEDLQQVHLIPVHSDSKVEAL